MLENGKLIERLKLGAMSGTLSHAYLITGEKGMGKKTLAKELCLRVFCKNPDGKDACLKCPGCKKVLSGNHPDIIFVTHEKKGVVSVDDIRRDVAANAEIRPYEGGKKIFIVDEAEKMTPQAQNAILKTLEEPPEYVIILLLCSDEKVLLDTIRSRCVKLRPEPVPKEKIRRFLIETLNAGGDEADICASFAEGNPGRALELCESSDFKTMYERVVVLLKNLNAMSAADIAESARSFVAEGMDLTGVIGLIELWYRDVLRIRAGDPGICYSAEKEALKKAARHTDAEKTARIISLAEAAAARLKANVNRELTLELMLINIKETG